MTRLGGAACFLAEPLEPRLLLAAESVVAELDVNRLVAAAAATVTATPGDIGSTGNIFDGDNASLYRTANIDPVVVEVAFTSPKTVREFTLRFSHAGGDPAYRWKVEGPGGSLPDPPAWTELVGWTGTPSDLDSRRTLALPVSVQRLRLTGRAPHRRQLRPPRRVAHRRRPDDRLRRRHTVVRDRPPVPAAAVHRERDGRRGHRPRLQQPRDVVEHERGGGEGRRGRPGDRRRRRLRRHPGDAGVADGTGIPDRPAAGPARPRRDVHRAHAPLRLRRGEEEPRPGRPGHVPRPHQELGQRHARRNLPLGRRRQSCRVRHAERLAGERRAGRDVAVELAAGTPPRPPDRGPGPHGHRVQ